MYIIPMKRYDLIFLSFLLNAFSSSVGFKAKVLQTLKKRNKKKKNTGIKTL
jgi:hypothetical protein